MPFFLDFSADAEAERDKRRNERADERQERIETRQGGHTERVSTRQSGRTDRTTERVENDATLGQGLAAAASTASDLLAGDGIKVTPNIPVAPILIGLAVIGAIAYRVSRAK